MEWMNVNSFIKNWRLCHNKDSPTNGCIMSWGCGQMQTSADGRNLRDAINDKFCQCETCECQHGCCQNGFEDPFPPPPSWLPSPWRQLNRVAHFAISTILESNILQRCHHWSLVTDQQCNVFCPKSLLQGPNARWIIATTRPSLVGSERWIENPKNPSLSYEWKLNLVSLEILTCCCLGLLISVNSVQFWQRTEIRQFDEQESQKKHHPVSPQNGRDWSSPRVGSLGVEVRRRV